MDNMKIPVISSPFVKSYTITNVHIRVMNLVLYKSVNIHAILMDNDTHIDSKMFKLENEDYTNWGNDDNYITNYVLSKLGLTQTIVYVTIS
jgi:hypothetical protein